MAGRSHFTKDDDIRMLLVLHEKILEKNLDAENPCGLKIWETIVEGGDFQCHTAQSLATHMRRTVLRNFKDLGKNLPVQVYKKLKSKFYVQIAMNKKDTPSTSSTKWQNKGCSSNSPSKPHDLPVEVDIEEFSSLSTSPVAHESPAKKMRQAEKVSKNTNVSTALIPNLDLDSDSDFWATDFTQRNGATHTKNMNQPRPKAMPDVDNFQKNCTMNYVEKVKIFMENLPPLHETAMSELDVSVDEPYAVEKVVTSYKKTAAKTQTLSIGLSVQQKMTDAHKIGTKSSENVAQNSGISENMANSASSPKISGSNPKVKDVESKLVFGLTASDVKNLLVELKPNFACKNDAWEAIKILYNLDADRMQRNLSIDEFLLSYQLPKDL